jgi:hypothetical protein
VKEHDSCRLQYLYVRGHNNYPLPTWYPELTVTHSEMYTLRSAAAATHHVQQKVRTGLHPAACKLRTAHPLKMCVVAQGELNLAKGLLCPKMPTCDVRLCSFVHLCTTHKEQSDNM